MNNLALMNEVLEKDDDLLTRGFTAPGLPVYFIFGLPRSGSTLLQQILTSSLRIGYVSNILAKFWKAPFIGAMVEQELMDDKYISTFTSEYGNTSGLNEPHEWGWFWKKWLKLEGDSHYVEDDSKINYHDLSKKLAGVEHIKQAPLLFDSVFAMANIKGLKQYMDRIKVIHIKRDPYFVANSIINARIKRFGTIDIFYGHRPADIARILSIDNQVEQIVCQVKSIMSEIEASLKLFRSDEVIEVNYEQLVEKPMSVIMHIRDQISSNNCELIMKTANLHHIRRFTNRNSMPHLNKEYKKDLDYYFKKQFY